MINPYIGNENQLYGVVEYTLHGGYKEDVRMLRVYNADGLDMHISLDRNADVVNLSYKGKNISYITPNGIRHHSNYIPEGDGWIKHFTAGFLTTCGYENVGSPCEENGVKYPLHGSINYIPVDSYSYEITNEKIIVKCIVLDEAIFSRKIKRIRTFEINLFDGEFSIEDEFENRGGEETPLSILYHMNIGYPLLKEDSIVRIDNDYMRPRNEYSAQNADSRLIMEKPTPGYSERVYFYKNSSGKGFASVESPSEKMKLTIQYNSLELPYFSEWKMMGIRDYVLGLEPGNVTPEGYVINKKNNDILILKPNETLKYKLKISIQKL